MKFNTYLYAITAIYEGDLKKYLYTIEESLKAGVTLLQLREKDISTIDYINLSKRVKEVCDRYKVPLLIDDRIDVCMAVDAAGVHLGEEDMPIDIARNILGPKKIIGATAKTVEKAVNAEKKGADYLGVGAIYETATKVKTVITKVETLSEIVKSVNIPVNAIGGLNSNNLEILKGTGISGICVISDIMKAKDPKKSTEKLLIALKDII